MAWSFSSPQGPIVFVHSSDEHYGADRVLLDVWDALPRWARDRAEFWLPTDLPHGAAPLCATLENRGARVLHLDLPVLRRAYRSPRDLMLLTSRTLRLVRGLRRRRPALVYCTTSAALLAAPAARAARVPSVVGHIQELWSPGDRRVLRLLARACDRLIANSTSTRSGLTTQLQHRTSLVLNCTPAPAVRTTLAGRTGPLSFVVASRWTPGKGYRTLLAAWDNLTQPHRLVVLGGPPPSGEAVDVRSMVAGLARPDRVTVVGEVDSVDEHLTAADVAIVPSDKPEGFGLVAIEAFARARPVVAADSGGLTDVVTDGVDGWFFPPTDASALAALLDSLSRADMASASERALLTYEQRFTRARFAAAWSAAMAPLLEAAADAGTLPAR